MPKINATRFQEIAKPLSQRCSALLSQILLLPTISVVSNTSSDTPVINTLPAPWATFLNDLSELQATSSDMLAIIREYFTNHNLDIDRTYSDEIIKFYVAVINPINLISVTLFQWLEALPASATKTFLLRQEIALFSLNLKFTGLITNNYFYNNTRHRQVTGFDHETQISTMFVENGTPTTQSYNSTNYPKLLEDTFFSLGRSYEVLGDLALAEINYTEAETVLESLIERQSHARDDLELKMRHHELFGKLAFLNFKLKRYYASKQLFDQCLALSTVSDRARTQQERVIIIRSMEVVRLLVPMILHYDKTGQFDQALTICNMAPVYYQQQQAMAADATFNYTASTQQVVRLAPQIRKKYREQITAWTSELPQGVSINCSDNSCAITISDSGLRTTLPVNFAESFNLQKETASAFSITNFADYPPRRVLQLFKALKQLSFDSQHVRTTTTRRKNNFHTGTAEIAEITPVAPAVSDETGDTSSATSSTSTTSATTEPKLEKIKTRGTSAIVAEVPASPTANLTTLDITYDEGITSPTTPCSLHRLHSRTLPLGPYAYTNKAKITAFFTEHPDISDKANSVVAVGKIVPRFGEQGIKYCRKENTTYSYKIKFLGHHGNSRIYGKTVGVIHGETGDVPVIEFSHCVRKAH